MCPLTPGPCVRQAEHSMELHMPFITYTLKGTSAKLVPVLVGALDVDRSARCPCSCLRVMTTHLFLRWSRQT